MKTIPQTITLFIGLLLSTQAAYSIPATLGGLDADKNLNQKNYESCRIQGPSSEAIDTATEFFNCHLKEDPALFCHCVDRMAEAFNIPIDESVEKFKNYYTNHLTLKLNTKDILNYRRQIDFLNQIKPNNASACSLDGTFNEQTLKDNEIGDLINKKANGLGRFFSRQDNEFNGNRRGSGSGSGNRGFNQSFKDLTNTRNAIRGGQTISKESNIELVNLMVKSLFRKTRSDGETPVAQMYLNLSKELHDTASFSPIMHASAQRAENGGLGNNSARRTIFNRIKEDIRTNHPDIYGNSSLGAAEIQGTETSDLDQTFQDVLGNFLLNYDKAGGDFEKAIPQGEIDPVLEGHFMGWVAPNRATSSFGFDTALAQTHRAQCSSIMNSYKGFIERFKSVTEAQTIQDAIDIYDEQFKMPTSENAESAREAATEKYKSFENAMSRIRRIRLRVNPETEFSRDEQIMPFLMDLHYCHKAPTKPVSSSMKIASQIGEISAGRAVASIGGHSNLESFTFNQDPPTEEEATEIVTEQIRRSRALKYTWDQNSSTLASLKVARNNVQGQVDQIENELQGYETLSPRPIDRIAEKSHLLDTLKADLAEHDKKIEELEEKNTLAHTAWLNYHTIAKDQPFTGEAYRKNYAIFVHDYQDCMTSQFVQGPNGSLVANPNYESELARCDAAKENALANNDDAVTRQVYLNLVNAGDAKVTTSTVDAVRREMEIEKIDRDREQYLSRVGTASLIQTYVGDKFVANKSFTSDYTQEKIESATQASQLGASNLYTMAQGSDDPFGIEKEIKQAQIDSQLSETQSLSKNITNEIDTTSMSVSAQELAGEQQRKNQGLASAEFDQFRQNLNEVKSGFDSNTPISQGDSRNGIDFNRLGKIQTEADELSQREATLAENERKYQESISANKASDNLEAATDPDSPYARLLDELKALRSENANLRGQVEEVVASREDLVESTDDLKDALEEKEDEEDNLQVVDRGARNSNQFNNVSQVSPGNTFSNTPSNGINNPAVANVPAAPNKNDVSLPIPESIENQGGGDITLPASGTRGIASVKGENGAILNTNSGIPLTTEQGPDPMLGAGGFELFLSLVGSDNEVSIETFKELRFNPEKFDQLNLDRSKPLIVKTPKGHLVMMPVITSEQVSGFRYIKEVKPDHVERGIASQRTQLARDQSRLIREADLESLLATEREISSQ